MSGMDCIVVGGVADGTLLRDVDMDAEYIELRRPEYIKPLAAPDAQPDVQHEKDVYEIHPIGLQDTERSQQTVFGIAVVSNQTLTWAFTQLIVTYVEKHTEIMRELSKGTRHG
jgi:hypothetical protein